MRVAMRSKSSALTQEEFGPSPALSRDLNSYLLALGQSSDVPSVEIPAPRTAWEHYELGRSYLRSHEPEPALREFRRAVEMKPDEFWPYFSLATCALDLGQYEEGRVVADRLRRAWLRGRPSVTTTCRGMRGPAPGGPRAAADYSHALKLNPAFTDAAVNRGVLALLAGRHAEAASDFRIAERALPASEQGSADLDSALSEAREP